MLIWLKKSIVICLCLFMPYVLASDDQGYKLLGSKRKRGTSSKSCNSLQIQNCSHVLLQKEGRLKFSQSGITCDPKIFDYAGKTFDNAAQDCSESLRLEIVEQVFKDLNADQTKLLVHAIKNIYRDKNDKKLRGRLERFTAKLKKDQLQFLLKQANYLENESLQSICTELLAQCKGYSFQELAKLAPELAVPIVHKRFLSIDRAFLFVGGINKFECDISNASVMSFGKLDRYVLIRMHGKAYLYDMVENSYKLMPAYLNILSPFFLRYKDEYIYFYFYNQFHPSLFKYHTATGSCNEYKLFGSGMGEYHLYGPVLNAQGNKVACCTSGREFFVFDVETGGRAPITRINENERFLNCRFNQDGDRIIITSDRRIDIYDVLEDRPVELRGVDVQNFFGEFVHFNKNNTVNIFNV